MVQIVIRRRRRLGLRKDDGRSSDCRQSWSRSGEVLDHDRYYRDRNDLRLEERAALNYDHPDSLETDLLVRHLDELRAGRPVEVPPYDFSRYARLPSTATAFPRRAIIVEGILVFCRCPAAPAHGRFIRRLQRDVAERGRTMDSVIDQYQSTVKPMHLSSSNPASGTRT